MTAKNLQRWLGLLAVFVFFSISIYQLDHTPPIFEDEPWILAPGYKLFTHGVFGSDLLKGFQNMDQHYLQFMPLFPMLQGAFSQLIGVGIFQLRFVPVCAGTLCVALVFCLARQLGRRWAGPIAAALLIFWQWMPAGSHINLPSGVPFVDLSRLARYDVLAAMWGLCALAFFVRARRTQQAVFDWACGGCVGLAGLSHVYGLFWLPAFWVALMLDRNTRRYTFGIGLRLVGMAALLVLPWGLFVLSHLGDAMAQARVNATRFDVFNPQFYVSNLLLERRRYLYGLGTGAAWWRPGVYSLLVLVPLAWLHQVRQAIGLQRRSAVWLTAIALLVPFQFAALLQPKTYQYLPIPASLFILIVAVFLADALAQRRKSIRVAAAFCMATVCAFGASGIVQMHRVAQQHESPVRYLRELRQAVPAQARVLARPNHWPGLMSNDFRNFVLPFYRSMSSISPNPVSFDAALAEIAPDVILLDQPFIQLFQDRSTPTAREWTDTFWRYMHRHNARLTQTVYDNWGQPIEIYWLDQP